MACRILIAELKTETATFNPWPTDYEDFRIYRGHAMIERYRGTQTEISGALEVFLQDASIEIVPTMAADAVSGGTIRAECLRQLASEITQLANQHAYVDGVYLCLHGAMAGEDEDDPEGQLLEELRAIFPDKPIVASLDLHAVLTDRMIRHADVLVPFHTYPHVDQFETGQRSARCLLRLLSGRSKPEVVRIPLPMLVRGDELLTKTGKFGAAMHLCQRIEADARAFAAGVIIGNAFTDVSDLQSNVIVTYDSLSNVDAARWADDAAMEIARFMWRHRASFQAKLVPLEEAIQLAQRTRGLTVFSDAADATASGASGDSNAIMKGLIQFHYAGKSLIPIVDAPAVATAFRAGVGGEVTLLLGGTRDPERFTPLQVTAKVVSLYDGHFTYENGTAADAGRVAVLCIGNMTVMVTERSVYVVGRKVFESHGLDPCDFDLVVVKSPNGFRTWYEAIAARIVPVDVPGSTSANLLSLPFKKCVRPIFPLDNDVQPIFSLE